LCHNANEVGGTVCGLEVAEWLSWPMVHLRMLLNAMTTPAQLIKPMVNLTASMKTMMRTLVVRIAGGGFAFWQRVERHGFMLGVMEIAAIVELDQPSQIWLTTKHVHRDHNC